MSSVTEAAIAALIPLTAGLLIWAGRRAWTWFNGGNAQAGGFVSFADAARRTPRERLARVFHR